MALRPATPPPRGPPRRAAGPHVAIDPPDEALTRARIQRNFDAAGAGYAADLALFPLSGSVMDRFGRLAAMVPAYGLLVEGFLSLLAADSASGVLVAGLVMGLGNGLSAGSLFTLSSDLAPSKGTASFLSGVALLTDMGRFLGPLLVGMAATWWGLDAAAVV